MVVSEGYRENASSAKNKLPTAIVTQIILIGLQSIYSTWEF